ncbi:hypothetical protein [Acinetobacter sp. KS-LM10]|uniref:hypothetical protein n=1 Tax=Acinetobacter sp. KS-LM10 TaxID=3120518 RepID=UPI0030D4F9D0
MNAKFELQEIEQNVIVQAFSQVGGTQQLVARIAEEARKHVPDVTTKKGRDAIGSNAMKVSKSKTLISKLGKDLVAEEKARIKLVDADRIQAEKELDALRDEILAPRDAWEQAEKDRVTGLENRILSIQQMSLTDGLNSSEIKARIEDLEKIDTVESWGEYQTRARLTQFEALEALRTTLVACEKYEAEQAELENLRLAEQARIQAERDAQIAREATEKANREAEEKARFEAEKVQRDKAESEQREARLLAEKEAAVLREQQLKIQAEQQAKQAEIDKQQAIEAERLRNIAEQAAQAVAERKAEEARLANREHMRSIHQEVSAAMLGLNTGLSDIQIKDLITAIAKNQIPHISIKY